MFTNTESKLNQSKSVVEIQIYSTEINNNACNTHG